MSIAGQGAKTGALIVAFVLAVALFSPAANAVKLRKVSSVGSMAKNVSATFVRDRKVTPKESANACLTRQSASMAKWSAQRGRPKPFSRSSLAKSCGVAHVYVIRVRATKKQSKASTVTSLMRRNPEYRSALRSSNHLYGASVYRERKSKRVWVVLLAGKPRPKVVNPAPPPSTTPTTTPTTVPTTAPTSPPTTVPTTVPTTTPTTAPTTVPTTAPTPGPQPDTSIRSAIKQSLIGRSTSTPVWTDADACVTAKTNSWAQSATNGSYAALGCGSFHEGFVVSALAEDWYVDSFSTADVTSRLVARLLNHPSYPTDGRGLQDALAGQGRIALSVYPTTSGGRFAVMTVTFDDPAPIVYVEPSRDPRNDALRNGVAAALGSSVVTEPAACVTNDIDARALGMATGQTPVGERQWDDRPLPDECDLYRSVVSHVMVPAGTTVQDIVSGLLSSEPIEAEAAAMLESGLGRLAVRAYTDYLGNSWVYLAVIQTDAPYQAPVRDTTFENDLKQALMDRVDAYDEQREDGSLEPQWFDRDECFRNTVNTWARNLAANPAKHKSYYSGYRGNATDASLGTQWGGMTTTFASTECSNNYGNGYVIASSGRNVAESLSDITDAPAEYTKNGVVYGKNWGALSYLRMSFETKDTMALRSYRDFRGDVWTFLIVGRGTTNFNPRLTAHQKRVARDEATNLINAHRVTNGVQPLAYEPCIDLGVSESRAFAGSHRVTGGSIDYDSQLRHRPASMFQPWMNTCSAFALGENLALQDRGNDGSDSYARDLARRAVNDWKNSTDHNKNMLNPVYRRMGFDASSADESEYQILTAIFLG